MRPQSLVQACSCGQLKLAVASKARHTAKHAQEQLHSQPACTRIPSHNVFQRELQPQSIASTPAQTRQISNRHAAVLANMQQADQTHADPNGKDSSTGSNTRSNGSTGSKTASVSRAECAVSIVAGTSFADAADAKPSSKSTRIEPDNGASARCASGKNCSSSDEGVRQRAPLRDKPPMWFIAPNFARKRRRGRPRRHMLRATLQRSVDTEAELRARRRLVQVAAERRAAREAAASAPGSTEAATEQPRR